MARPATKKDLLLTGNEMYEKLITLLDSFTDEALYESFAFDVEKEKQAHWKRDKNIRDVLIHLYEWHQLLLRWVDTNLHGVQTQFLKEGYNWKTYGNMNIYFWEIHQETTYEEALQLFQESHQQVMQLADSLSNDELFTKNTYSWVGGSVLGSYFVSVTSSHYDWALKKLHKYKKSL